LTSTNNDFMKAWLVASSLFSLTFCSPIRLYPAFPGVAIRVPIIAGLASCRRKFIARAVASRRDRLTALHG
jgi:hypothetical protein